VTGTGKKPGPLRRPLSSSLGPGAGVPGRRTWTVGPSAGRPAGETRDFNGSLAAVTVTVQASHVRVLSRWQVAAGRRPATRKARRRCAARRRPGRCRPSTLPSKLARLGLGPFNSRVHCQVSRRAPACHSASDWLGLGLGLRDSGQTASPGPAV
jgi:hypothetical protein